MLIRIIAQYLESHRRLIIPQMGAFIVKEPGSSVLFSELLKRDDGALRALLVAEGVPELEAAGEIDRFVFEVRHAVQQGREFPLAGLGMLKPGPNGTIAFAYDPQVGGAASPASAPASASAAQPGATRTAPVATPQPAAQVETTAPLRSAASAASAPAAPAVSAVSAAPARPAAPAVAAAPEETEASRKLASAVQNLYGDPGRPARPLRSAQPVQSAQPARSPRPTQPQSESPELPQSGSAPRSRFQLATKKLKRDELFADSYYGRLPRRPAIEQTVRVKKRSDHFLWIALIAALIALAAIAFGEWTDSFGREGEEVFFEQPAHDLSPETMPEAF